MSFVDWSFWSLYVDFDIFFVKIDCEYLSNLQSQNPWITGVWEARNCWKEPDDIKAFGCIFLPYYIIQWHVSFP